MDAPDAQAIWYARLDRASRDRDGVQVIDETSRALTHELLSALAPKRDPSEPSGWREPSEADRQAAMDKFMDGLGRHFGIGPKPR